MRRIQVLITLMLCMTLQLSAQLKQVSFEQAFKGMPSKISKPLPAIRGWVDDEHYIELRKDESDGQMKTMSVDVKTGKAVPYSKTEEQPKTPSASSLGLEDVKNITLSPDGKYVAYTKKNDLYSMELASKKETRLTNDGTDLIMNGYASWIYYEEILGRASRYRAFWWAPDSKHIAYMRFDDTQVPMFPIYVADGQHGYLENTRYPKPGDKNPEVKIGITSVDNPSTVWADFNEKNDQYFGTPKFTPQGDLWVEWMNRNQDTLIIYQVANDGSKKQVYLEHQKTWITLDNNNRVQFLDNAKGFILTSDKDGWENLYLHDMSGKLVKQLTTGNFWGTDIVKIDNKNKQVYFQARKENSARFDFYKVGFDGKGLARLTFGEYSHDQVWLSPNAKYFITAYSNVSTPTTMALVNMKGKVIKELGDVRGEEFDQYALPKTELVRVKSFDQKFDLPVSITYPINFDKSKKYPIYISIYGGPNAGTVYDRWRPTFPSNLWLSQEGIVLVSIDNRSSGHFGKEGLNYIYRQLGKYEIEDYMAAAKYLRSQSWADTNKVAITGGSFGGYMTCMALTYGADYFTHGIANASVTDWSLYDTHYTERFMDTPGDNPEGYKATSVMTYADKYKGLLKIIHGTTDDNVHMQQSLQLINVLEDLGKHFELMIYPNERHGIGGNNMKKGLHNRNENLYFIYKELLEKPFPAGLLDNKKGF